MIAYARAPLRISFAGGGSDVEPFCSEKGGCVVSTTIAKYVWARAADDKSGYEAYPYDSTKGNLAFIEKIASHFPQSHVSVRVDAPHRSGLGGSGAMGVAVVGCLNGLRENGLLLKNQVAELAYNVEHNELGFSGGRQDQYASAHGGINFINFEGGDNVKVCPLDLDPRTVLSLERSTFLVYTHPREDSNIIDEEIARVVEEEEETIHALEKQKELATNMKDALLRGDIFEFGALIDQAWEEKKKQTPSATNGMIEELYKRVKKAGALGGKVAGAGGGGYFLVFAPGTESKTCDAIASLNLHPESIVLDQTGLKVWSFMKDVLS